MGKIRWLVWAGVAMAVAVAIFVTATRGTPVTAIPVGTGRVERTVTATGTVEARSQAELFASGSGRVSHLTAAVGDRVTAGQVLAEVDCRRAELSLEMARAQAASARSRLESLERGARSEELESARAALNAQAAALAAADRNLKRAKALHASGAISQEALQQAEDQVAALTEAVAGLQAQYDLLANGATGTDLAQARSHLAEAEAATGLAELAARDCRVTTPIAGVVTERPVVDGQVVGPGARLFVVDGQTGYRLVVEVAAADVPELALGQTVRIRGDALGNATVAGTVEQLAPATVKRISSLGVEQQRLLVDVGITEETVDLKPGFRLTAHIITGERAEVLRVPDDALWRQEERDLVFAVQDGRLQARPVQIGLRSDEWAEVVSGLNPGAMVVRSPDRALNPGVRVNVRQQG